MNPEPTNHEPENGMQLRLQARPTRLLSVSSVSPWFILKTGQNTPSPEICPLIINKLRRKPGHSRPVLISGKASDRLVSRPTPTYSELLRPKNVKTGLHQLAVKIFHGQSQLALSKRRVFYGHVTVGTNPNKIASVRHVQCHS